MTLDSQVPSLRRALQSSSLERRLEAVLQLNSKAIQGNRSKTGDPAKPAKHGLIQALRDSDERVIRIAGFGLDGSGLDSQAIRPLLSVLKEATADGRQWAASLLGRYQSKGERLRPVLCKALNDSSSAVRQEARRALDRLDGRWRASPLSGRVSGFHENIISALAISPDGDTIASGSYDGTVLLWALSRGKVLERFRRRGDEETSVSAVAFSRSGGQLAIADRQGFSVLDLASGRTLSAPDDYSSLIVYDSQAMDTGSSAVKHIQFLNARGRPIRSLRVKDRIDGLVSTPGSHLLAVHQEEWAIIDGLTGSIIWRLPERVERCLFTPDGRTLASIKFGAEDLRIWEAGSGKELGSLTLRNFTPVGRSTYSFSPDGHTLSLGASLVDVEARKLRWDHSTSSWVRATVFTPDGRTVASAGDDHVVTVRNAQSGKRKRVLGRPRNDVDAVAAPAHGAIVAARYQDGSVRLWDHESGRLKGTIRGGNRRAEGMAFSPKGNALALARGEGGCQIWDVPRKSPAKEFHPWEGAFLSVAWSPGSDSLALGGWSTKDGAKTATGALWDLHREAGFKLPLALSKDLSDLVYGPGGTLLAGISYGKLVVWQAQPSPVELEIPRLPDWVCSLAFSPDGALLACGMIGYEVIILDTCAWQEVITIRRTRGDSICSIAFSPDGKLVALAESYDNGIEIRDVATGALTGILRGHRAAGRTVVFAEAGSILITGACDGTVRTWDGVTYRPLRTLSLARG